MTDKLYYESSHRKDFEAQVISCEPEGEGYKVVLDKTVFFPGRRRTVCRYRKTEGCEGI